jgi:hypothetical protein
MGLLGKLCAMAAGAVMSMPEKPKEMASAERPFKA